jgi:radical SAM protein with 4Fe4S-binding SPASM domain
MLSKHFCVDFKPSSAHDATYNTSKLAGCVAEALYRGVMLPTEPQGERIVPPNEQRLKQMFSKKPAVKKVSTKATTAKKVAKKVAPVIGPLANFIPGVGPLLSAAIAAGTTKLSGGSWKDALKAGAFSYGAGKLSGGIGGLKGAVTPCCQTMGPPNESKSVLGHVQNQTLEEIWYGEEYNNLRKAHEMGDFNSIDYCKNCDFLYEDPEVLVWSNDKSASTDYMLGTNFSLKDYKK